MKHIWTVLSTRIIEDKRTNMLSMIDVCDGLSLDESELPNFDQKAKGNVLIGGFTLNLATMWFRSAHEEPESGIMRSILVTPDGKRFNQPERKIDLEAATVSRSILLIDKLVFRGFGLYWFRVEQRKKGSTRWTFEAEAPLTVDCKLLKADNSEAKQDTKLN
jgi:hypothetical protein